MSSRVGTALIGVLLLASCGSEAAGRPGPEASTVIAASRSDAPAAASGDATTAPATPPDLTRFVAAVDAALADTTYAGAALTDPEVFIATGQLFCELLDDCMAVDDVLVEHLDALDSVTSGAVTDSDAAATGAVLGAAVEVICPHHAGRERSG